MHMSDALLSPAVGTTFGAASLCAIGYYARKLKNDIDEKLIPLMGVFGAFVFASQMINFTIPGTGSSGHIGGGMLLAILLGPRAAFLVMASVLTVQAFFFADGGLLALGCNIWNLSFYPCFIAYPLIYKPITGGGIAPARIMTASIFSAIVALQLGAFSVVLQTLLSGKSELPFATFILMMLPIHLAIGLVEGVITAGVINYVRAARPEILESVSGLHPLPSSTSLRKVILVILAATVITGGFLSWFASTKPDGLEWSIEKVFGRPELPNQENGIGSILKGIQEKMAFLPGYGFKEEKKQQGKVDTKGKETSRPNAETGASLSGIIGSAMVISLIVLFGVGVKFIRKRKSGQLCSK